MAAADYVALIRRYFPQSEWQNAYNVMMFESGGNPRVPSKEWSDRERSVGLFQINTNVHPLTPQQAMDPETNVRYAAQLWQRNGWSSDWVNASRQLGLGGNTMAEPVDEEDRVLADYTASGGGQTAGGGDIAYYDQLIEQLKQQYETADPLYQPQILSVINDVIKARASLIQQQQQMGLSREQLGLSAQGQQYDQAYRQAQLALQEKLGLLSHQIAVGDRTAQDAMNLFSQEMQNQQAMLEAAKWAVPEGLTHFPGYGPGGAASTAAKLMGVKPESIPITRVPYSPVQTTIPQGGFPQPNIPPADGSPWTGGGNEPAMPGSNYFIPPTSWAQNQAPSVSGVSNITPGDYGSQNTPFSPNYAQLGGPLPPQIPTSPNYAQMGGVLPPMTPPQSTPWLQSQYNRLQSPSPYTLEEQYKALQAQRPGVSSEDWYNRVAEAYRDLLRVTSGQLRPLFPWLSSSSTSLPAPVSAPRGTYTR